MARPKKTLATKRRNYCLRISPEERALIQTKAAAYGCSMTDYIRAVAQDKEPVTRLDAGVVAVLHQAVGNQRKIGGLIRLALDKGQSVREFETMCHQSVGAILAAAGEVIKKL